MGNSSHNSHANVAVALERGQYHAGEVVRGYVSVSVQSSFSCTDVYVIFHGDVRTTVHYTRTVSSGKTTHTVRETAWGRERIVEESRLVARFNNGQAMPGFYQFPFEFSLHPFLPSSAYVPGHDHACIAYGVEVKLVRPNIFKWDLVHRAYFDLVANVPHAITDAMRHDRRNVNCCCCFGKGFVDLGAALERNAFRASEDIVVRFQMANESTAEVKTLAVELHEKITMNASGHRAYRSSILASNCHVGVGPGNAIQPTVVSLRLPPAFMHCSVSTGILQIEHYVEVRADTPCCIDNPKIRLPVTLHRSGMVAIAEAPPQQDEDVPYAVATPYQPDPNALQSPVPVTVQAGPAVVPITAQAMQGATPQGATVPVQQQMATPLVTQ